jgi:hypothetical protein
VRAKRYGEGPIPCGSVTTPLSNAAAEKGQAVCQRPGTGARQSATLSAVGRRSGGEPSCATSVWRGQEERNRGSGGVEERQILEKQSMFEVSDHVQMCVSSVGGQARRSATGGSQPPVSWVRWSDRWTARRGAPPCDMDFADNIAILQGGGKMEAGSEQCKEQDEKKKLPIVKAES